VITKMQQGLAKFTSGLIGQLTAGL